MNAGTDSAGMIGLVAKWFIRLIALVVAFDALGLPAVSEVLQQLLLWLPNVVVALVVLVIGGLAARALSNLVRGAAAEAGISNANLLSKVASALIWAFAIVVAVNQIGIATTLVNTLFMAFVGAIALGLGLAFGLGGRETAGQIVSQWYGSAKANSDKLAHAADAGGRMASSSMGSMGGSGSGGGSGGSGGMGGQAVEAAEAPAAAAWAARAAPWQRWQLRADPRRQRLPGRPQSAHRRQPARHRWSGAITHRRAATRCTRHRRRPGIRANGGLLSPASSWSYWPSISTKATVAGASERFDHAWLVPHCTRMSPALSTTSVSSSSMVISPASTMA
jgi:hypothetical protein